MIADQLTRHNSQLRAHPSDIDRIDPYGLKAYTAQDMVRVISMDKSDQLRELDRILREIRRKR